MARAYPEATVDGFDVDAASIALARRHAADAGVATGSTSSCDADAAAHATAAYDAVFAFECVHDMPRPVDVLAESAARYAPAASSWSWTRRSADALHRAGRRRRAAHVRLQHAGLPAGRDVDSPSARHRHGDARGHVARLRPGAGFTYVEVLPIEDFGFWRFYRLAR